ncbi:putative inactive dual specificity protein phosphatase-like [Sesamum angolense]|uniref:Inactive dual specificity protein phosphatase-like n=1 Tax=Sesamum angolense TaxID=2727404 RepID=A0AAE2BVD9_9LAMI|nr:putative inactive dual specificity protein phosphatase-like [Sesamum angolense]
MSLRVLVLKFSYEIAVDTTNCAMEPTLDNISPGSDPKPPVIYRCKKCRRIVATEEHIVSHKRGRRAKVLQMEKEK